MVSLECKFSTLKKLVKKDFTIKELENILLDLGFELDNVKGDELKIDITSERPDAVSTHGLARILRNYFEIKNPHYVVKKPLKNYEVIVEESVKKVRPYTVCAIIKNLNLNEEELKELIWVQEKIHDTFGRQRKKTALGIYPLEKIKLPIRYKADKPRNIVFTPLDSPKEMNGEQILNEHKTGKEYKHLLEGKEVYPFFIDSNNEILSMPPIINSEKTGRVTLETKELFVECSGHNLETLTQTLNILVHLFIDMGAEVYSMNIKYKDKEIITPKINSEKRTINPSFIKKISGLELSTKQTEQLLRRAGHNILKTNKEKIIFEVNNYRTDIWHDVDIVDDVLKIYGINNLEPTLPMVATHAKILLENALKKEIAELMIGLGFQEIFTLSLTNKDNQYKKMNVKQEKHIELGSTVEQSISMLRTWLLPDAIKTLHGNRNKSYPQKLFEVNDCIIPDDSKDVKSKNVMKMSTVIADAEADFTKIKQTIVYLLESLGIKKISFKTHKHGSFIEGRCAKVIIDNKEIGILGEINPQVLENWDLEILVSGFELNVHELLDTI